MSAPPLAGQSAVVPPPPLNSQPSAAGGQAGMGQAGMGSQLGSPTAMPPGMGPSAGGSLANGSATSVSLPGSAANPQRPATNASDPNWSGYGTTPTFGSTPPGLNLPPGSPASPSGSQLDPLGRSNVESRASTNPAAGLRTDPITGRQIDPVMGRQIDPETGWQIDPATGRKIDPATGRLVDSDNYYVDAQNRRVDSLGRPIPNEMGALGGPATGYPGNGTANANGQPYPNPSTAASGYPNATNPYPNTAGQYPNAGNLYPNAGSGYPSGGNLNTWPPASTGQSSLYPGGQQRPYYPAVADNRQPFDGYQDNRYAQGQGGPTDSRGSSTDSRGSATDFRGPSDGRNVEVERQRAEANAAAEQLKATLAIQKATNDELAKQLQAKQLEQNQQTTRVRRVAVQPFFYFLFLVSVIGNAYLIFETSNLRRKFRNMIASVRATKVTAQPLS